MSTLYCINSDILESMEKTSQYEAIYKSYNNKFALRIMEKEDKNINQNSKVQK